MDAKTVCPQCQRLIRASGSYAGRRAKCPDCKSKIRFPSAKLEFPYPEVAERLAWSVATRPLANQANDRAGDSAIETPLPNGTLPASAAPAVSFIAPSALEPIPVEINLSPETAASTDVPLSNTGTPTLGTPMPAADTPVPTVEVANASSVPVDIPVDVPVDVPVEIPVDVPVIADGTPQQPIVSVDAAAPVSASGSTILPSTVPISVGSDAGAAPQGSSLSPPYSPLLRKKGEKKSMAARSVDKAMNKLKRGRVKQSQQFRIGEEKSFWERVHCLGTFPQEFEIDADEVHVLTVSDRAGEFRLIMPFDDGVFCPVEYVSVLPGRLPTSLGLLRGRGANWGLRLTNTKAGSQLHPTLQALAVAAGGQPNAIWTVLDGNDPCVASDALNQIDSLKSGLVFDRRLKLGPMEVDYELDWAAQALPLGTDQYLLIVRYIPSNKMMSINFGVDWFLGWRDQFKAAVPNLPGGDGRFCCLEYGIWAAVVKETMGIDVL